MIYDGKKITALREERGWSMAELARRSKLSQPSLWALEHQRTVKPKHDTMIRIANALNIPIQSLMVKRPGGSDNLEQSIIESFHSLNPQNQAALVAAADALLKSQSQ